MSYITVRLAQQSTPSYAGYNIKSFEALTTKSDTSFPARNKSKVYASLSEEYQGGKDQSVIHDLSHESRVQKENMSSTSCLKTLKKKLETQLNSVNNFIFLKKLRIG